jgi:cytochrome c oxidase cbb3-type subunit 3
MNRFPKKIMTLAVLLSSSSAFAAGEAINEAINDPMFWAFGLAISMLLLTLWALNKALNTIKWMSAKDKVESEEVVEVKQESAILSALTDAVPIENEHDILLNHNYDGIMELDNNLPPWWKYGFYLTIIWAIGYFLAYQVFGMYPLQEEEFKIEMAEGNAEVEEYIASLGALVDESNVVFLEDAASISKGKNIFAQKCVACHLSDAGGNAIGPNLTDDYWINGDGSMVEIFKVLKYGGRENSGMQSWDGELSAQKMQQVSSFVMSLRGSTPAVAKDPQGEFYPVSKVEEITEEMPLETDVNVTEGTVNTGAEE